MIGRQRPTLPLPPGLTEIMVGCAPLAFAWLSPYLCDRLTRIGS